MTNPVELIFESEGMFDHTAQGLVNLMKKLYYSTARGMYADVEIRDLSKIPDEVVVTDDYAISRYIMDRPEGTVYIEHKVILSEGYVTSTVVAPEEIGLEKVTEMLSEIHKGAVPQKKVLTEENYAARVDDDFRAKMLKPKIILDAEPQKQFAPEKVAVVILGPLTPDGKHYFMEGGNA